MENQTQVQTQEFFKITRHDGTIQFATKTQGGYLLYNSGFTIVKFDALSVEPIDSIPNELFKGIANYEGDSSTNMKAICNPQDRWNGWAKPYIHLNSINKFIKLTNSEDTILRMEGDNLRVIQLYDGEIEFDDLVNPTIFEGEKYYYVGDLGLVFEFKKSKK